MPKTGAAISGLVCGFAETVAYVNTPLNVKFRANHLTKFSKDTVFDTFIIRVMSALVYCAQIS